MPGAGALDRRIVVERYTTSTNDLNEEVKSWATLTTVWAGYQPLSDGETIAAGELGAHLLARFIVRSSETTRTITGKDRIVFAGANWNIKGAKETPDGRLRFIEITAAREAD